MVFALSGSVALLLAPATFGAGVVRTWTGAGNGNLRNNTNWNGGTIPTFNGNANGNTDALLFSGAPSTNADTSLIHVNTAAAEAAYGHQLKNITFSNAVSGGAITSYTFDAPSGGSQTFVLGDTSSAAGTGLNTGFLTNNIAGSTQTFLLDVNGGGATQGANIFKPYEFAFRFGGINAAAGSFVFGAATDINLGFESNAAGSDVTVTGAFHTTINGTLLGTGTDSSAGGALIKTGTGTLFLNGNSTTWNGRIMVADGVVQISASSALGTTAGRTTISGGANTGQVRLLESPATGGLSVGENLYLGGRTSGNTSAHIGNAGGENTLTGTITLDAGGSEFGFSSAAGTLKVQGPIVVGAGVVAPHIRLSGDGNGVVASNLGADIAVIKDGAGTWTLSGAGNTFTGTTTINAGRLNLATSATGGGGGLITVGDGASLGVALTGASTFLNSSALTLGSSTGGTTLSFDLGSFATTGNPYLVTNTLTLNGTGNTITIQGNNLNTILNQPITLISYTSGTGVSGFTLGALPARVTATLNTATAGKVYLTVTGFDYPRWIGSDTAEWSDDAGSTDWQEVLSSHVTHYIQGDRVLFDDLAEVTEVTLVGALTPTAVTVNTDIGYSFLGSGKLSGATGLVKQGTGTLILENGEIGLAFNDYTGTTRIEGGVLQVGNFSDVGQLGSGNVVIDAGASLIFKRTDSFEVANDISGSGLIRKENSGSSGTVLTLSGNNAAFTGTIEIAAGAIKLGGLNAASGVSAVTVEAGGILDLNGQALFGVGQTVRIVGDGESAGALVNTGAGSAAVGVANLILDGDSTIGGSGSFYIPGSLTGNTHALTKLGGNTVFLSNIGETHLTDLTISAGRVTLIGNTALNADPGTIYIQSGELGLENSTAVVAKNIIFGATGGLITATAGTANQISGNITLGPSGTTNTFQGAGRLTVSGNIDDAGAAGVLTKSGAGVLVLKGSNTYTGGTNITAGTLVFDSLASFPVTGAISSATGTTIGLGFDFTQAELDSKVAIATNQGSIALGVSTSNNYDLTARGATASLGAYNDVTYSGTLALNGPAGALTAYQFGGGGGTLTVTSLLSGATSVNIGAGGSGGTTVLTAANTYTLGTTITTGTLRLGNAAALGAATNPLTISGASTAGTLDLNGYNLTVGSLASGANTALITDSSTAPGTTTITVNITTGSSTYQGSINNGANGRVISLVKDGAGTLVINKANGSNYTGDTIIRAGKLDVKINNAQALPAASKLIFEGTGTLTAAVNSAANGVLTLAGLAFNAGEGTVESFRQNAGALSGTLTLSTAPTRASGATGNFTLNGTTDPTLYKVVITSGATGGQSLNGGIYFGGSSFAAYAAEGYVRGLDYALDSNGLNVVSGATLGVATNRDVQLSGTVSAQGTDVLRTLRIAGAYDLTLTGADTLTLSTGGLIKAGGSASTISGGGGLTTGGGDLVVNTAALADTLTLGTAITATTNGLTKTGLGTLILGGANSYAGDTLINGGTLQFLNLAAISPTTAGSKIRLNTGSTVGFGFDVDQAFLAQHLVVPATGGAGLALGVDSAQNYDFSVTGLNYAAVSLGAVGNVTYTGTLTPNGTTYRLGGGGGTLTYGQQITGANALTVNGGGLAGTVFLTGANTLSGVVTVEGGTLKVGSASALGTGKITVTAGTLDLNGFDIALRNLSGGATGLVTDNSVGSTANVRVNVVSGNQTYSGSFANGTGGRVVSLIKEGNGTLILTKANGNTYGGDTVINAGILRVRTNNAQVLPAQSQLVFNGTGTFSAANNAAATVTTPGALTLARVSFNAGQGTVENLDENATTGSALGHTLTFTNAPTRARGASGNFVLSATSPAVVNPANFKFVITNAPATNTAIDGGIHFGGNNFAAYDATGFLRALSYTGTDTNALNVAANADTLGDPVVVGGKDVQISGGATIAAQTSISLHTLKLSGASNLSLASGETLTVTSGGLLKADGGSSTIIGGAGVTTGGSGDLVVRTDLAADTLTINSSILSSTTGGLTKAGAGKLTLAAANNFTGGVWVDGGTLELTSTGSIAHAEAVNVNAGTVIVSGSLSGVTNLNLKSGATLTGIGTIAGDAANVAISSGGIVAPGAAVTNAIGKLTLDLGLTGLLDVSVASLGGTGYLRFELGATADQIALTTGALNIGNGTFGLNDFQLTARTGLAEGTYVLFDTASAILGTLDTSNLTGTLGAFNTTLGFSADGQDLVLTVAVPEPSTALSLFGGLGLLVGLQRFRRRSPARFAA